MCDEGCLLHVFRSHLDLVVSRETIHEGEDFVFHGVVDQNVNVRKWEVILRDCPIQVSVIYTHPYLTVLLRYHNNVSNPLWIGSDS